MLLAHWHFCNSIQLNAQETAEYLDTLFMLECGKKLSDYVSALNKLDGFDELQRCYMLPVLLDLLLTPAPRTKFREAENEDLAKEIILKTKALIHEIIVQSCGETVAVPQIIKRLDRIPIEDIPQIVWDQYKPTPTEHIGQLHSYLETPYFTLDVFWLSILRTAGRECPYAFKQFDFTMLLDNALRYLCGELPWQLALEIHCIGAQNFREIQPYLPNDWMKNPIAISLVQQIVLLRHDMILTKDQSIVYPLMLESYTFTLFEKNYERWASNNESLWIDPKANLDQKKQLCASLWQISAWETGFRIDRGFCIRLFHNWWNATFSGTSFANNGLSEYGKTILRDFGVAVFNENMLPNAMSSPWQRSKEGSYQEIEPFGDFPHMKEAFLLMRSFYAAILLRDILGEKADGSLGINFHRLLLNLGDAFNCSGARQELSTKGRGVYWSRALCGLGLFADRCIQMLGMGLENSQIPEQLISILTSNKKTRNIEINRLKSGQGYFICAHWAVQSLRYGTPDTTGKESPWFATPQSEHMKVVDQTVMMQEFRASVPMAKIVCVKLFNGELYDKAIKSDDALQLLYQKYQYDPDIQIVSEESWYELYLVNSEHFQGKNQQLSIGDLITSQTIPFVRWTELDLKQECFDSDAWLLVLTQRMSCILQENDIPPGYENQLNSWYQQWQKEIFAVRTELLENKHILLNAICNMLRPQMLADDSVLFSTLKDSIAHDILDLIYEITTNDNVYYLRLICKYLGQSKPHRPFNKSMLQAIQRLNIQKLYELSQKHSQFEQLLNWYLVSISETLMQHDALSIRKELFLFWQKASLGRYDLRSESIQEKNWRSFEDRFLHRKENKILVARPITSRNENWSGQKVQNRFEEPTTWEMPYDTSVGIIVNEESPTVRNGQQYNVSCGGSELIRATCKNGRCYEGQVVHVKKTEYGNIIQIPSWQPGPESETILVQIKELSIGSGIAQMTMILPNRQEKRIWEKHEGDRLNDVLDIWTPDTRYYFEEKPLFINSNERYETYYNEILDAYLPVKRSFARLLLECILIPENPEKSVALIYIHSEQHNGLTYDLFSVEPGKNYLLARSIWTKSSQEKLVKNIERGVQINAKLYVDECVPYLHLDDQTPFDRTNLEWADLLQEGNSYWMEPAADTTNKRCIKIAFQGNIKSISCYLVSSGSNNVAFYAQNYANVQLITDGWNRMGQRKRVAKCEQMNEYKLRTDHCQMEQIRELITLKAGDIVRINRLLSQVARGGYYTVMLNSGILAMCAAESLSMLDNVNIQQWKDRICIVENIHDITNDSKQSTNSVQLLNAPENIDQMDGVVTVFAPAGRDSESFNTMQEVTFVTESKLIVETIPINCFQSQPQSLGARVTAIRQSDGRWQLQAHNRRIYIRALWKTHAEKIRFSDAEAASTIISRNVRIPGYGNCIVSQDHIMPTLHLWPEDIVQKEEPHCGVADGIGTVKSSKKRFCNTYIFPYAKNTEIVCLNQKEKHFWGEANWGEFGDGTSAWTVDFFVGISRVIDGESHFDIRRIFHREQINSEPINKYGTMRVKTYLDVYQEWLNSLERHVMGEIVGNKLVMHNMRVPVYIDAATVADNWTNIVPLLTDGDRPWVTPNPEQPYSRTVRAIMTIRDNQWYASCRNAEPFQLNDKLVAEMRTTSNETIRQVLYYAGPEPDGHLRFEWGLGYCFLVRPEDIVDTYGNNISMELFYGDRVKEFQLRQVSPNQSSEFGWIMIVSVNAIQHEITWQIWQDSLNNILQLLRVKINPIEQTVEITEVSMIEYSVNRYQRSNKGWSFRTYRDGRLTPASIQKLLLETTDSKLERIIIACVDRSIEEKKIRGIYFEYISIKEAEDCPSLLQGKTLCLTAGKINPITRDKLPSNDYALDFYLPDSLPNDQDYNNPSSFVVSVLRRAFSLDESKLRVLYMEDKEDEFYRKNMLVKIFEKKNRRWTGSVLNTPSRHVNSLREWVENKPNCLVILGNSWNDNVTVEVSPGIFCNLPTSAFDSQVRQGAIALLSLVNDSIHGQIILPSDSSYIPAGGRAVELLPKDDTYIPFLGRHNDDIQYDSENQKNINDKCQFTVASFPQLVVSSRELIDKMICMEPPRLGWLQPDKYEVTKYNINTNVEFYAARLVIDSETKHPKLRYIHPEEKVVHSEWSLLSYMDALPERIAEFARHGKWHYHDKETAVYNDSTGTLENRTLLNGKSYKDVLLFPNNIAKLRTLPREIVQNAYSAREIAEYGFSGQESAFPVAYTGSSSLWIELMPGRIIELPKDYLFFDISNIPFKTLHCQSLVQGDLIHLHSGYSFANGQRQIYLTGFTFGGRHHFRNGRNFLPIIDVESDSSIRLGSPLNPLIYPLSKTDDLVGKTLVSIDPYNNIQTYDHGPAFRYNDTVMITIGKDGYLCVAGYSGKLMVMRSHPDLWENAQWIYELLGNRHMREQFFKAIGGYLTVKVTNHIQDKKDDARLYIAFAQEDLDALDEDTIICGKCLGYLNGAGEDNLLIQSGHTILRIPRMNLLPSLNRQAVPAVISQLLIRQPNLWLYKSKDGWRCGINTHISDEQVDVELLCCVEEAGGILCSNIKSKELYWLPKEQASRTDKVPCKLLWEALCKRPIRQAKVLQQGLISLIGTSDSRQKFAALDKARDYYRVVPCIRIGMQKNGTIDYVAEVYPMGDLVYLNSEYELLNNYEKTSTVDPIPVQLVKASVNHVRFVPVGSVRTHQLIPEWINRQLRENKTDIIRMPNRFQKYEDSIHCAISNQFNESKLKSFASTSEKLCYLAKWFEHAKTSKKDSIDQSDYKLAMKHTIEWLRRWMEEDGWWLAVGFDTPYKYSYGQKWSRKRELDLKPLLAAVLLLHQLECPDDTRLVHCSRVLAVHLVRMIGLACDQSLHIEVLLSRWLLSNDRNRALWRRLSGISLGGVRLDGEPAQEFDGFLTTEQMVVLKRTCENILHLCSEGTSSLKTVAMALLHSTNQLDDYKDYGNCFSPYDLHFQMNQLAVYGRVLTPALNKFTPMMALPQNMFTSIQKLHYRMKLPLSIMTERIPLPIQQCKFAVETCGQFMLDTDT